MADHPNVALMRKGYGAYETGDLDLLRDLFAPDIKWHVGGRSPLAGEYNGIDEVFGFFGKILEMTGGQTKLELHDVLANDEHAVALVTATNGRNGKTRTSNDVHVFHLKDGRVTEFWDAPIDRYGDDEFFS